MPDNRAVHIYRKSHPDPIKLLVRDVENLEVIGVPTVLSFTTDDGRKGRVLLNPDEIEAVVVHPAGIPDE